jgi:hypothetical protein
VSLSAAAAQSRMIYAEQATQVELARDILGNPFSSVDFLAVWRNDTVVPLAREMYMDRDFGLMPIVGDALEEAGCYEPQILEHCRAGGPHVRGCWVLDLVLGYA